MGKETWHILLNRVAIKLWNVLVNLLRSVQSSFKLKTYFNYRDILQLFPLTKICYEFQFVVIF